MSQKNAFTTPAMPIQYVERPAKTMKKSPDSAKKSERKDLKKSDIVSDIHAEI